MLAVMPVLAFSLASGNFALAGDFTPQGETTSRANSVGAATSGFSPNQNVTVNFSGLIISQNASGAKPTILPYSSAISIVNISPVVTAGQRPLVVGGSGCTVTIYGVDAAGNLYDISSAAWMSVPGVVTWTGGTVIPNVPTNPNTILQIGVQTQAGQPGKAVGLSFSEQAPSVQANPATNIQVSAVVEMNKLLPNGAQQSWAFNDLVNTVAAGTVVPPPAPPYNVTVEIPANPPYTTRLLNVPAASITAVAP